MAGSAAASVVAVPFWVVPGGFGDHGSSGTAGGSQGTGRPSSAKLLPQFGSCDSAQAQVQLHALVIKLQYNRITEFHKKKKSYIFLPTLTNYSTECFICRKFYKFNCCFILKTCNSLVTHALKCIETTVIWQTAREAKRKDMAKVSTYIWSSQHSLEIK